MNKETIPKIQTSIEKATTINVIAHARPDGDAVGSVLALGLALRESGKEVEMILADGVPADFRFLEGAEDIEKKPTKQADLVIVVDSGDLERIGSLAQDIKTVGINIDHHPTNTNFGELNYVITEAVSTTEILTSIIPQIGLTITKPVAQALLMGLLTDSQGFKIMSTTAETLRTAAQLMDLGADIHQLAYQSLVKRSFKAVKYWGAGLSLLQHDEKIVWTSLSLTDRNSIGYGGNDDADLVNLLSAIEETCIAIMFVEQSGNKIKISWRAKKGYNVAKIAGVFGGGGHIAAAGAMVEGSLQEVQERVLAETRKQLN
ncbi:MAG: bifunctional oligoribonuclease/PAP phosphatase NrnA [Chloroflexota bacterium]